MKLCSGEYFHLCSDSHFTPAPLGQIIDKKLNLVLLNFVLHFPIVMIKMGLSPYALTPSKSTESSTKFIV